MTQQSTAKWRSNARKHSQHSRLRGARRSAVAGCTLSALTAVSVLTGCAGGESLELPGIGPITTGSLPDPSGVAQGATDQVNEMALVAGITKAPTRERLKELFAIDQKCYSIVSQDEVWQAVKAEKANRKPGEPAPPTPPVSNPWTAENKEYYKANCTEQAQQARSQEMRSLHL
ncbi:MAG: hypothetical protein AAFV45_01615 [Pseudomonadota bacterium]